MELTGVNTTGPPVLSCVNWSLPEHQRHAAASLVEATYFLEHDRQKGRRGSNAQAPPMWKGLHFKLCEDKILIDSEDSSIYGAIYELITTPPSTNLGNAPKFVIVFRGNVLKKKSLVRDLHMDLRIGINNLHRSSRCKGAVESARELVAAAGGPENVWIAGHSLGASMATAVGKTLAVEGRIYVKTFLFNPPFVTFPVQRLPSKVLKGWMHTVRDFVVAGIATAKGQAQPSEDFDNLSSWVPNVFVNPADIICSAYIGYFEHRTVMDKLNLRRVWQLGVQGSIRDTARDFVGEDSDVLRHLPSANLTVNYTPEDDAHCLDQWYRNPHRVMSSQDYLYE